MKGAIPVPGPIKINGMSISFGITNVDGSA